MVAYLCLQQHHHVGHTTCIIMRDIQHRTNPSRLTAFISSFMLHVLYLLTEWGHGPHVGHHE